MGNDVAREIQRQTGASYMTCLNLMKTKLAPQIEREWKEAPPGTPRSEIALAVCVAYLKKGKKDADR